MLRHSTAPTKKALSPKPTRSPSRRSFWTQKKSPLRHNTKKTTLTTTTTTTTTTTAATANHSTPFGRSPSRSFLSKLFSFSTKTAVQLTPDTTNSDDYVLGRRKDHAAKDLVGLLTPIHPTLHQTYDLHHLRFANLTIDQVVFTDICQTTDPSKLTPRDVVTNTLRFLSRFTHEERLINPHFTLPDKFSSKSDINFALLAHLFDIKAQSILDAKYLGQLKFLPPPGTFPVLSPSLMLSPPTHSPLNNKRVTKINAIETWDDVCDVLEVMIKGMLWRRDSNDIELTYRENEELEENILIDPNGEEEEEEEEEEHNEDESEEHNPEHDKIPIAVRLLKDFGWTVVRKRFWAPTPATPLPGNPDHDQHHIGNEMLQSVLTTLVYLRPTLATTDRNAFDSILSRSAMDTFQLELLAKTLSISKFTFFDTKRGEYVCGGKNEHGQATSKNLNLMVYRSTPLSIFNQLTRAVSQESTEEHFVVGFPVIRDLNQWKLGQKLGEDRNNIEFLTLVGRDEIDFFRDNMKHRHLTSSNSSDYSDETSPSQDQDTREHNHDEKVTTGLEDRIAEISTYYEHYSNLPQQDQLSKRRDLLKQVARIY